MDNLEEVALVRVGDSRFIIINECMNPNMWAHMLYEDFDDAKRLKLFNIDSSQDQEIKRNDLQIVLYMLKESLKEVAKVWP